MPWLLASSTVPVPTPPTGLRIFRLRGRSFRLGWNEVTSPGHIFYRLYHSTDDVTYVRLLSTLGELYLHLDLPLGTHYYKVASVNAAAQESALSSAVSLTIGPPDPFFSSGVLTAGVPLTLDFYAVLSRNATNGTLVAIGPGLLYVELSSDGITWTNPLTLRPDDYFDIADPEAHLEVHSLRLDTDVTGTGYSFSMV